LGDDFEGKLKGNNLASLPTGEQVFGGVRFHIGERLIQLRGHGTLGPEKVEGIQVAARRLANLYLLHATQWEAEKPDTCVGYYTVRYTDGGRETVPIVYGRDVSNWWAAPRCAGRTEVAWEGDNAYTRGQNSRVRLYLTRWANPTPGRPVAGIDFASTNSDAAPFCVAMTAETPPEPDRQTTLDLQPFATRTRTADFERPGNNLENLPAGESVLAGVRFQIGEGVILLSGTPIARGNWPERADGIRVGKAISRLYILHATHFNSSVGEVVGHYTVHYEGRGRETIPVAYGKDVCDWWCERAGPPDRAAGPGAARTSVRRSACT
jgi:hypothetical protein